MRITQIFPEIKVTNLREKIEIFPEIKVENLQEKNVYYTIYLDKYTIENKL